MASKNEIEKFVGDVLWGETFSTEEKLNKARPRLRKLVREAFMVGVGAEGWAYPKLENAEAEFKERFGFKP